MQTLSRAHIAIFHARTLDDALAELDLPYGVSERLVELALDACDETHVSDLPTIDATATLVRLADLARPMLHAFAPSMPANVRQLLRDLIKATY